MIKRLIIKKTGTNTKKEGKKKIQRIIWRKKYIKREYGRNKYQNMSKENKQKLKECQKIIMMQENRNNFLDFFSVYIKMLESINDLTGLEIFENAR